MNLVLTKKQKRTFNIGNGTKSDDYLERFNFLGHPINLIQFTRFYSYFSLSVRLKRSTNYAIKSKRRLRMKRSRPYVAAAKMPLKGKFGVGEKPGL